MKGYLLDFGLVENPQKYSGISDQAFRTLGENEMILQMFSQKTPSISIGYDDTKAPHFKEGVEHYRSKGLKVGIRGAGGRSVANDEGILNFSILFKSQEPSHAQYVFFHKFIQNHWDLISTLEKLREPTAQEPMTSVLMGRRLRELLHDK